jgi:ABC-type cobalamin/Fe3+-siderophores transport system ATPase subunit
MDKKHKKRKKKRRQKLPNELIIIDNPDKTFHEHWSERRNLLNIPHPFRAVLLGPPNVGKTTVIKNILVRAKPAFEEIFVIHADPEYTQEYDDIDAQMLDEIPSPTEWEGEVKTLVILDDLEYKQMDKLQKKNLDRLFGYVSTHKNISVMLTSQDAFNVPPIVRRTSNLWILWKSPDMDSMATVARKTGMRSDEMRNLFNTILKGDRDSLWIDATTKTPAPLRKNGFIKLTKKGNKEEKKDDEFETVIEKKK